VLVASEVRQDRSLFERTYFVKRQTTNKGRLLQGRAVEQGSGRVGPSPRSPCAWLTRADRWLIMEVSHLTLSFQSSALRLLVEVFNLNDSIVHPSLIHSVAPARRGLI